MKDMNTTSSIRERCIIVVLDAILVGSIAGWAWEARLYIFFLQILVILSTLALGLLLVLSVAAWRHGFRWFFSRRALRFYGWLIVGIISVIVLLYSEESWRGKRAWAALQKEVAARGESLELSSVSPPPVPDDQNFALAPGMSRLLGYTEREPAENQTHASDDAGSLSLYYGRGHRTCPATANWALQQATDLAAWQKFFRRYPLTNSAPASNDVNRLAFPVAPEPQSPAADVLLALSRYDSALAVLRRANERPGVRYPIAYENGLFALTGPMASFSDNLNAAVHILCLRAIAELAQDRGDAALQDTLLALRLADSLRQEPYDQLQNARATMFCLCLQPVWEGLAGHRWNEAQLLTLQQRFAALDILGEFRLRGRGETLVMMNLADQLHARLEGRPSAWGDRHNPAPEEEHAVMSLLRLAYPVGWLYQDKVWIYRYYAPRAEATKALDEDNRKRWQAEMRRATDPALMVLVIPRLREVFHEGAKSTLYLQTACHEATVACALERCRLAQGKYPASLEELVPNWLKQVPTDLLAEGGAPLKYRREADGGFVLYSVGLNGVDDQGKPGSPEKHWGWTDTSSPRLNEGDWVWRQPGQP
jgi:hypothetical protein